jgi:hypothetical protein
VLNIHPQYLIQVLGSAEAATVSGAADAYPSPDLGRSIGPCTGPDDGRNRGALISESTPATTNTADPLTRISQ